MTKSNKIIFEILSGVYYIHKAGLIHRDLKPGNILINLSDWSARIWDFGLARSLSNWKDWEKIVKNYMEDAKSTEDEEELEGDSKKMTKSSSNDNLDSTLTKEKSFSLKHLNKKKSKIIRKGSDDGYIRNHILAEVKHRERMSRALKATLKEREEGDRELTPHVVTRFYRPPEVILMDKNYNQKVDIWGVGAIFWELLKMKKENWASYLSRKSMFTGRSWAPLSPSKRKKSK